MDGVLIQNILLRQINPLFKAVIKKFDVACEKDGNLLSNSLREFLGEDITLCEKCNDLSHRINSFYELYRKLLRVDKTFMKSRFLNQEYGEAWLKGFVLMMKGIEKFGVQIPFVPAGPFHVVWDFTQKCNLKCRHCYSDARSNTKDELSTSEAFKVIDELSNFSNIGVPSLSFSGGEPLMRGDFFEVLKYAKNKIPFLSIATNGTLLTKKYVKKIKEFGINYVEISLDGISKERHESFRGVKGCFEKTIEGISNCIDEKLDTCIATTVYKHNIKDVPDLLEFVEKKDSRFIHFNYIPTGRAKRDLELDLSPRERFSILNLMGKKIVDSYVKSKEENKVKEVDRIFSTCPQFASVVKEIAEEKKLRFAMTAHYAAKKGVESVSKFLGGCGAGRLYMCISSNGDIKPCVFFPTNNHTVIGNILKDEIESVWDRNQLLYEIRHREKLRSFVLNNGIIGCGNCEDKYICGGCRARSYSYFHGSLNEPDIGCIKNEDLWKVIIN